MEGDRSGTDRPSGSFGDGPSAFVRTRNSRDEEFGPAIELNDPPNTSNAGFAVWGPVVSADGTLLFASDRGGAQQAWAGWQTMPAKLCDINADGSCDADDLTRRSLFSKNLQQGSERSSDIRKYDISGDGLVDATDLTAWLSVAAETNGLASAYLPGDANLDGQVAFGDFLALADGFGGSDRSWTAGNFNGDREVDFTDFLALSTNFGTQISPIAATVNASTAAVPEPAGICLAMFGILGIIGFRKRG